MSTLPLTPEPLEALEVTAPDASWQEIRDAATARLLIAEWTDHNVTDPGITMLEAGAFSLADLHYRTETRKFSDAAVSSHLWHSSAHWSGVDLPLDTGSVGTIAESMAHDRAAIDAHLASASDRPEAVAALVNDAFLNLGFAEASAIVRLVRSAVVREAAFDAAGIIDTALDTTATSAEAIAVLRADNGFDAVWDAELADLVRLQRRRRLVQRIDALRESIVGAAGVPEVNALLAEQEPALSADERLVALSYLPCPELVPERFEDEGGRTRVWPPTAIQSRSVEPVVADDYARLALQVTGVRRAWVRPGQLLGTGWDGRPITTATDRPGTVTILIEPEDDAPGDLEMAVLRGLSAPGDIPEVDAPHALYRDDPSQLTPRRMICDEIGVASLEFCPVEIKAALHVAVGTIDDRSTVIDAAHQRLATFLEEGRPESQPSYADAACPADIDGPWPVPDAPPSGWIPGEPIRINEIIEKLGADPAILGVSDVALRYPGGDWFSPGPNDVAEFPLAASCVPRLTTVHCLTVAYVLSGSG